MDIELRIATAIDKQRVDFLVVMINEVYKETEGNIWIDDYQRISKEQLIKAICDKELLLAVNNQTIYGCAHLLRLNNLAYKFKMLVANPKYKGTGIGSKLVTYVEQTALGKGASIMQLELLVPTEFIHQDKVFLHNWYTRIGYELKEEHNVDYVHQGISRFLKTGCVAKVYEKVIG